MTTNDIQAPPDTAPTHKHHAPENISLFCPDCEALAAKLKNDLCRYGANGCINKNIVTILINKYGMRGI